MHENRNLSLVLGLLAALVWGFAAWFVLNPDTAPAIGAQRWLSLFVFIGVGGWLFYALRIEDKLPDHLGEKVGGMYYAVDGVSFMPTIRKRGEQAELCVFYQNNYENQAQVIVHLRPPDDAFVLTPGVHDIHFAFLAGGGDYGALRQPIAIPEHVQGEVLDFEMAAASHYPRSHGARYRRETGMPCGSLHVDWGGSAFKSGVHEVSGEIDLTNTVHLRLAMPTGVAPYETGDGTWRQECMQRGPER